MTQLSGSAYFFTCQIEVAQDRSVVRYDQTYFASLVDMWTRVREVISTPAVVGRCCAVVVTAINPGGREEARQLDILRGIYRYMYLTKIYHKSH